MTTLRAAKQPAAARKQAQFRYGAVFLLVLGLLLFEIVTPDTEWARAIDVALAGGAVIVAVATSRARDQVRRARATLIGAAAFIVVLGLATGLFGTTVTFVVVTLLVAYIPVALAGGLLRLVGQAGVTIQVVAGALTIYLVVGLLFASVIAVAANVESGPYFTQGSGVTNGERVYYSFTVLTTTGFGDFTAARPFGHALAVLEMLTGQLYLVTVIGIVVGNFARHRMPRDRDDPRDMT